MTAGAAVLVAVAALFAIGDWVAVAKERKGLEYVCKPATIAALIGAVLLLDVDHGAVRAWFVIALVLSLAGDVFLMLPSDAFVPGLVAFLLGHVAYVVGMWTAGVSVGGLLIGVVVVVVALSVLAPRILGAVRRGPEPALATPVAVYMTVISAMVVSAFGTGNVVAIAGAALFYGSDATIAWERFVAPARWHRLGIIVTYHLGQGALALSLVTLAA